MVAVEDYGDWWRMLGICVDPGFGGSGGRNSGRTSVGGRRSAGRTQLRVRTYIRRSNVTPDVTPDVHVPKSGRTSADWT
jgi:hypothetical protein